MDHRVAIWNLLHDGEITALSEIAESLTMFVSIPYLRRRLNPLGDSFVLRLSGVKTFAACNFDGKLETLGEQLEVGSLEILGTESKAMPVVIDTTMGKLTCSFEELNIELDSGDPITFEEIDRVALEYWDEWEQKAAKARDASA